MNNLKRQHQDVLERNICRNMGVHYETENIFTRFSVYQMVNVRP